MLGAFVWLAAFISFFSFHKRFLSLSLFLPSPSRMQFLFILLSSHHPLPPYKKKPEQHPLFLNYNFMFAPSFSTSSNKASTSSSSSSSNRFAKTASS